ncbi:hypothetical protein FQA39_LY18004 [Lamprigera yunnana]|nr:hypothetical protein FQA39_LY18004 [Lamprigera yunnana]
MMISRKVCFRYNRENFHKDQSPYNSLESAGNTGKIASTRSKSTWPDSPPAGCSYWETPMRSKCLSFDYDAHLEPSARNKGMAGRFPESDDVSQYLTNILNKTDMITYDNRRWLPSNPEIPHRSGKINFLEKLDSGYFGIHYYQVNQMDSYVRQTLERAYEAIVDAGLAVEEVRGSKMGVFIGVCFSETEEILLFDNIISPNFGIVGSSRSMVSQQISYHFGLQGPSYIIDSACSSSMYALEHGYRAIREGKCESALVGGVSLCLNSSVSLQFARLGVLSEDGSCKAFDEAANGYARSETIAIMLLQKAKDARRIYAQVLHVKTNNDGYKEQGIMFPSRQMQKRLMEDTYRDCKIDPTTIDFLEAHATGTSVGDPEEMTAVDQVFCLNRERPLFIGSIKSYLGHAEGASGMCSIIKVLLAMENDCLLPNINFKKAKESIRGLIEGRMKVVTDTIPWPKDGTGVAALNSFGFGGSNAHVILKRFGKAKNNNNAEALDDLPRLICISGRTEKSLSKIFLDLEKRTLNIDYVRLLQQVFKYTSAEHLYRGYITVSKTGMLNKSCSLFDGNCKRLAFFFSEPSQALLQMGKQLLKVTVFANILRRIDSVLPKEGKTVLDLISSGTGLSGKDLIVCSVAMQVALVDLFRLVGVRFNRSFGRSAAVLVAAYGNEELTLEEAILSAHHISACVDDNGTIMMRASLLSELQKIISKSKWSILERLCNETWCDKQLKTPNTIVIMFEGENHPFNGFLNLKILEANTVESLLNVLGSIYMMGHSLEVEMLYPDIKWPVSVQTPMLSTLVDWNHEDDWFAVTNTTRNFSLGDVQLTLLSKEMDWTCLPGHVIDGMMLMPATGYLYMIWKTFCKMEKLIEEETCIVLENVRFHKATDTSQSALMIFKIIFGRETHTFEVAYDQISLVSGKIYIIKDIIDRPLPVELPVSDTANVLLTTKDVYKELKLRGYNYSGGFRAIDNIELSGNISYVKWQKNWITFLDNMLQTKLLQEDTRNLYVPTCIQRLVIDASAHFEYTTQLGEEPLLPVHNNSQVNTISCGGVECRGLLASSIARRKTRAEPVLESYKFIPSNATLSLENAIRVCTQILLENVLIYTVKVAELVEDELQTIVTPMVRCSLDDQPLIKTDMYICSKGAVQVPNANVLDKSLSEVTQCALVVVSALSQKPQLTQEVLSALKEDGFVISREATDFVPHSHDFFELTVVSVFTTDLEKVVLLRQTAHLKPHKKILRVSLDGSNFDWISSMQSSVKTDEKVLLVVENEHASGALGFVNCLRRESGCAQVKCVFIMDPDTCFDPDDEFFARHLRKSLAINVLKNNKWGTYRHLPLDDEGFVEREHTFCSVSQVGNLSSLQWVEGPLTNKTKMPAENYLVDVYYAAINFKDVTISLGRISPDGFARTRLAQINTHSLGFEFSGIDSRGKRVCGMLPGSGGLSTLVKVEPCMSLQLPDDWTLEDGATIIVTYGTVLYSLFKAGKFKSGGTILIHAGSGGIGQSALHIASFYNFEIFTTVGTDEKRKFIRDNFPHIPDNHIGYSRDTSFEQMIFKETRGRGVDIVINSLVEEKLFASIRCLAPGGKFIEIGKYDVMRNNQFPMSLFSEGRSFFCIMLDFCFNTTPAIKHKLSKHVEDALRMGCVKPLHRTVFERDEVDQAYRYMAGGKHVGKILVKIREENKQSPKLFKCLPRFYCDSEMTYVVIGGLGGFGLELVDWLIVRGATKVAIVSRTGVKSGYASSRIKIWTSYQVTIDVFTDDVTTQGGCVALLKRASRRGPVAAIFNLAVVLRDGLFEDQNEQNFLISLAPKAVATRHLDVASRELCPRLQYFVVFSSVSCGRGNAGQTNYGTANSIMERICEKRKEAGYPALAIQWGAIGEVGLVAEMQELQREIEIGGTLQQRVSSCLTVLDTFLTQDESIVSSTVVAEKRSRAEGASGVIEVVRTIMGITDLKTISENTPLPDLGMDSLSGLEIKQTLERECEIFLNAKEIRTLSFTKLKEILEVKLTETGTTATFEKFHFLYRPLENENEACMPIKKLSSAVKVDDKAPTVYILPGVEGSATVFEPLALNLKAHVQGLQYVYVCEKLDTVEGLARSALEYVQAEESFIVVAYSFGCLIGMELVALLEAGGRLGKLILIDGSHDMFKALLLQQIPMADSTPVLETTILCNLMDLYLPSETVFKHKDKIFECSNLDERVEYTIEHMVKDVPHSLDYLRKACYKFCSRVGCLFTYHSDYPKIKSPVVLFKPTQTTIENFDEYYDLQKFCEQDIKINFVEGSHVTVLKNVNLAEAINDIILDRKE